MHIAFVTYEFIINKVCGGLGRYIANMSTILAEHGNQITIFLVGDRGTAFEWKQNITVIFVKSKNSTYIWEYIDYITDAEVSDLLNRSKAVNKKITELNEINPIDIIQYCGDDLSVWYRERNIPSVVRLSSFIPLCRAASQEEFKLEDMSWMKSWNSRFYFWSFMRADAVYSPSQFISSLVSAKIHKPVKVIESPCVIEQGECSCQDNINKLKNEKYLLFFGKLDWLKGIHIIRDSLKYILSRYPEILFVLAGRGTENVISSLEEAAGEGKDRIVYLGEVKDTKVLYSVIKNAYACVLPSRVDNLPNACIEAMGLGKIVIGTYGASFEQLIEHKRSGILIEKESPKALNKAVDYLMSMSQSQRTEMEEKAKERVEQMKPDIIYNQLISFYKEVINSKKKIIWRKSR